MTASSCHVTYAFQSESTLYSCPNVKELLAQSRCEIWSLSDCNCTWTHNHLVRKKPLKHLAKLALFIFLMFNDWAVLWVLICSVHFDCIFLSCHVGVSEWIHTKWLSVRLRTKWLWIRVQLQSWEIVMN